MAMVKTPLEDAQDFKRVLDDPEVNGYTSIKVIQPVINGYVSVHVDSMPLRVRLSILFKGVVPEWYTQLVGRG